jgi:hypothetical protein
MNSDNLISMLQQQMQIIMHRVVLQCACFFLTFAPGFRIPYVRV